LLFIISVFNPLPAFADAVINISPPVSTPGVGSSFDVFVNIASVNDLYAFQFDISFNPAIISAVSITEDAFLPSGGTTFFIPGSIDNTAGTIAFTADSLIGPIPGVSGSGTLAEIQFQALGVGTSPIGLSNVTLLDSNFSDISFGTTDGIASPVATAVPEPGTLLLFGTGLVGIGGFRRKLLN
jgi:hypothetical protein